MNRPTREEVKGRSPLLRDRYPTDPTPPETDDLDTGIIVAASMVSSITGRKIGTALGEEVPADLVPVALEAVTKWSEQVVVTSDADSSEEVAGGTRRLKSISAGPWSETYFGPGELMVKGGIVTITGNGILDALLWALMTEEKREEWMALATGQQPPAGVATTFDYRRTGGATRRSGYGY